jgi:hypothetical protein
MNTNSQASQDIFVRSVLNYKKEGTFLEIGSNDPIIHNNTYVLENDYDWKGIMVEYDTTFLNSYKSYRKKSIHILSDAQNVNYIDILDNNAFPLNIDYLQIDLDVNNKSTINTLELLNSTVFNKYKFATITFEHDIYTGDYFDTRSKSRKIFEERGYELVFPDVSVFWEGKQCQFEDWYVHKELVSSEIINKIKRYDSLPHEQIKEILLSLHN